MPSQIRTDWSSLPEMMTPRPSSCPIVTALTEAVGRCAKNAHRSRCSDQADRSLSHYGAAMTTALVSGAVALLVAGITSWINFFMQGKRLDNELSMQR